jgi:hypothetical protein
VDRKGFRTYLESRKASAETIDRSLTLAEKWESFAQGTFHTAVAKAPLDGAGGFSQKLISSGENTYDAFLALARYARFVKNKEAFLVMLETIDGHEAFGNLFRKAEEEFGAPTRDAVFAGLELPQLGISNLERSRRMRVVVERLEAKVGRARAGRLIGQGLRDLPDAAFADERGRFEDAGGIDEYLRRKGDGFIAELKKIRDEGGLYYSQPITDDVIDYVESRPEIRQGVRVKNVLYEAKIPYMAVEYLRETDPKLRAYYYCHCPWARESLRRGELTVSGTFCACSGAFHRRPYEVLFGRALESEVLETVLDGDPWCRFAIHLSEDVA